MLANRLETKVLLVSVLGLVLGPYLVLLVYKFVAHPNLHRLRFSYTLLAEMSSNPNDKMNIFTKNIGASTKALQQASTGPEFKDKVARDQANLLKESISTIKSGKFLLDDANPDQRQAMASPSPSPTDSIDEEDDTMDWSPGEVKDIIGEGRILIDWVLVPVHSWLGDEYSNRVVSRVPLSLTFAPFHIVLTISIDGVG